MAKLGELAEVKLGKMLSPKAFAADLVMRPYLRNENVRWGSVDLRDVKEMGFRPEEVARYSVEPGDLLACEGGEPGRCAVYSGPRTTYSYQKALHRVRPIPGVLSPPYLAFWLRHQSLSGELVSRIAQTTIQHLPLERFVEVPVALPPLPEQMRIAEAIDSYLSRLDEAEALLDRAQRNLRRYRSAVLQAAVEGRLVPTEAELTRGEGRDYEAADAFLKHLLAAGRQDHCKASQDISRSTQRRSESDGHPQTHADTRSVLPEGWCWTSLAQLGEVSGGLTKNPLRDTLPIKLPYLRVANVYADELALDHIETIGVRPEEMRRVLLEPEDLLVVEGNGSLDQIGRVVLWDGSISPCVHQNHVIKVRLHSPRSARWVLRWLLSPTGRREIERVASSTSGLHTLSLSKVAQLPVPLCPENEQSRILEAVDIHLSLVEHATEALSISLGKSSRLRQRVLNWAFEGKLVDQDPADEPASALLERIRMETAAASRAAAESAGARRRRRRGRMSVPGGEEAAR